MGAELKPVGRAVATAKGHYPGADGRHATVLPGDTFTVFEGRDKAKWFTLLKADEPAPAPVAPPAPTPEPNTLAAVASVERKRKAAVKAPTADPGDDIV
jgi:hypothetical protein